MIGRRFTRKQLVDKVEPRGFDSFELCQGDVMRGERATLGKSLLDVERELRIRASYIAAIENADPDAFDTPGFIPGYVRSYARYLGMDPDKAFGAFCAESGFSIAHGMSKEASSIRKPGEAKPRERRGNADPLVAPNTPYIPASESVFAKIEPGAVGSATVLLLLIGAIGFGGWSVLNEVQRVQFAPVENTPDVLADLDPLAGAAMPGAEDVIAGGGFQAPRETEALDRLYRPQALDVPVMVARDAPISTLDPAEVGTLTAGLPQADRSSSDDAISAALAEADGVVIPAAPVSTPSPQVLADPEPGVLMVAVRPSWVRVRAADGSVIFEGILNAGDTWDVPVMEEAPTLRAGESGAIYFTMNGLHYGPAGARGSVISGLPLDAQMLADAFEVADLNDDSDLQSYVAELQAGVAATQE